jgi:hypothetical protein
MIAATPNAISVTGESSENLRAKGSPKAVGLF